MMIVAKVFLVILAILAILGLIAFVVGGVILIINLNHWLSDPVVHGDSGHNVHERQWV